MAARMAAVCQAVVADRKRLDDLDAAAGDGDTGTAFARGANAVTSALDDERLSTGEPARMTREIGDILARDMGAHHARHRIAIGNADARQSKLHRAGDHVGRMGRAAQEGEVGCGDQFGEGGRRIAWLW